MKFNKRLLSFFLAVLMVVSTFGDSVYAISENAKANSANKTTEIEGKVEGDKEVFTFDLSEFKSKESVAPMSLKAMPARAPRRAPVQYDTEVNITAIGLNNKPFNWEALPNKEFKLIAKWETTDGQKHEKEFATITKAEKEYANVGWPVDGTMKGNASVVTNYNTNIEVRVAITSGSGTGGSGKLTFDITLRELAEPRANVEYIDPYGRPITDPADLPSATDTMPKVTADELSDVEIDLPKTTGQINMRSSGDIDDDELNTAENGLTYKVGGKVDSEKITIGEKEYIVDISQPSAKEIATIKMVYQKDVVIPPAGGDGNPVAPADGYVRLTFDANENKADGVTGTHNAGAYAGKQKSYIDVKEGLDYTNANLQAAIKALATTGTKLVGTETKQYAQDAENPWTPKVPADATKVATATYNAQYKKSAAEQVEELGGLKPETIKVWKDDPVDWKDGVTAADINNSTAVRALIEQATVTDLSKRSSEKAGKFEGKLLVTFEDKSTLEVDKQLLIVSEHIVTIDPNNTDPDAPKEDDLPDNKIKVLFEAKAKGGVNEVRTKGTTYAKLGTVFQEKDFPSGDAITFEDGYKGPVTWAPEDHTITNKRPGYVKGKGYVFRASATKLDDIIGPVNPGETPNPDTNNYWTVTFKSADEKTGTVDAKNTYYVLKTANKTLADLTAPNTTPAEGYTFNKWTPAVDKNTAVDKDIEVIGTFVKDVVPQPGEDKPDVPDNFVLVEFKAGDHGTIAADAVTKYWVNPDAVKTLADITKPGINAAEGWKHTGWDKADTEEIKANLTVTAQYEKKTTPTSNADDYDPHYTDKSGKPGETVQIDPPTFTKTGVTGNVPAPTTPTKGTTFTKNDKTQTNVTVDPNTGAITVEIPENAKDGDVITVPVDVTYPDGSNETVEVKVKVENKVTPPEGKPSVTYPTTDMDKGETKTVIPEIKDKDGKPTRPDGTPDVVQPGNGVVVTPHPDGSITVTIPEGYDGPSTIVIPVEVTVDGEKVKTNLIIRVNDDKPVIDYDIPELKIHEYTPTYPVYTSVEKKVVEVKDKEVINSHDQYIFGYPDDTIRPDGDMTRAEAIAVVARLQKLDLSDKSSKIYKDTKADMWYNGAINAAFREGYLLEKEGENVRPNDKITRAELAELISHIDKKNNAVAPFEDVKGHKFEAAINQAYGNGRIEGYPDGTFKPDNFITRAEVATMLNKLYDRYPDKNFIDANQNLVHNYKDMSYKGHWGYYELVEAYHSHTYLRLKDNMEEWKVIIK